MKYIRKLLLVAVCVGIILTLSMQTAYYDDEQAPSKYPGMELMTETFDEQTYRGALHYPKFRNGSLNSVITAYVSRFKEEFFDELKMQDEMMLVQHPGVFYLTFEIFPVVDQVYSLVFSEESYISGANGRQNTKIFLVDMEFHRFIGQGEIIDDTRANREQIYELLNERFKQSERYKSLYFEDELRNIVLEWDDHFSRLYSTEESAVFRFAKHEVAAGALGIPEISIPLEQFKDLLNENWQRRLSLVDTVEAAPGRENTGPEQDGEIDEPPVDHGSSRPLPADNKRVVLTFDDGPHPEYTPELLALLAKYDVQATFFMLGSRVDFYPAVAQQVAEHGHELGNHTWSHKDLTTLGQQEIEFEIFQTNEIILAATGREPTVFRPPYGATNDIVAATAGTPVALWTVDTLDWKTRDPKAIVEAVVKDAKDGSVILMHDIYDTTIEAVEPIIVHLLEEGYEFVTFSELMAVKVDN